MTYIYWALALPTGLLTFALVGLHISGRSLSAATPVWLSLLGACMVLGMLFWSYLLTSAAGRPGLGVCWVLLSWLAFGGLMTVNGLLNQQVWN